MAVSDLHRQVALTALGAARRYGFALAGGNALLAHGVSSRPTRDLDLFTNQEHGVEAAAGPVQDALAGAGFTASVHSQDAGLDDIFPCLGEGLTEWDIIAPGGGHTVLQLAYFDRSRQPVLTSIGPVLALEDVAAGKVAALASRIEPRDYADTARLLQRYTPAELISFARRLDSGLGPRDFAEAGQRLDEISHRNGPVERHYPGWLRRTRAGRRAR